MKFRKFTAILLSALITFSAIAGTTALATDTEQTTTPRIVQLNELKHNVRNGAHDLPISPDVVSSDLVNMKYLVMKIKATTTGGNLTMVIVEKDTAADTTVQYNGYNLAANTTDTIMVNASTGAKMSQGTHYNPGGINIYINTTTESYIIARLDATVTNSWNGKEDDIDGVLSPEKISALKVHNGGENGMVISDFALAETLGDAYQYIALGDKEIPETVSVLNGFNSGSDSYRAGESFDGMAYIGMAVSYKLSEGASTASFQCIFKCNDGDDDDTAVDQYWQPQQADAKYYLVNGDGTYKTSTVTARGTYSIEGDFNGYIIMPLGEFIRHPNSVASDTSPLSTIPVADFTSINAFAQTNMASGYTFGNIAVGTTLEELIGYYTGEETSSSGQIVNNMAFTTNNIDVRLQTETTLSENSRWFGMYIKNATSSALAMPLGFIEYEADGTSNSRFWVTPSHSVSLLDLNGYRTTSANTNSQGTVIIPANYEGFVVIDAESDVTRHPGYGSGYTNETLELANVDYVWIWSEVPEGITYKTMAVGETRKSLYEALLSKNAEEFSDNSMLLNRNTFTPPASSAEVKYVEAYNLKYDNSMGSDMLWLGFELKNTSSVANFCDFQIFEKSGSLWWLNGSTTVTYYNKNGTYKMQRVGQGNQMYIPDGFDGYAVAAVKIDGTANIQKHPGYSDANGALDLDSINLIKLGNSYAANEFTIGKIALATSQADILAYLKDYALHDATDNDVSGEGSTDILDLLQIINYVNNGTSVNDESKLDANLDETFGDWGDVIALRNILLNK